MQPDAGTPGLTPLQRRATLAREARRLTTSGLTHNATGNLSCRIETGFLVTPTGMAYDRVTADDIVEVSWDGAARGRRLPSSEWHFHRAILMARPEVSVVLHAHAPFATTLACLREPIPAFHYMVAVAGGIDIRCAPYATFGTEELSRHAVAALEGRRACLLANHGMIALGHDFDTAFSLAIEVETLSGIYWRARQIGAPILLDAAEMQAVIDKFKTYGQQTTI